MNEQQTILFFSDKLFSRFEWNEHKTSVKAPISWNWQHPLTDSMPSCRDLTHIWLLTGTSSG